MLISPRALSRRPAQEMAYEYRTIATGLIALAAAGVLAACGEEPRPISAQEFMENPILLEVTMVRCMQNRSEARSDKECLNAREAVDRIAAKDAAARRGELEALSARKREALRRAQEAARQRALEEQRRQEEAELVEFTPAPEGEAQPESDGPPQAEPVE